MKGQIECNSCWIGQDSVTKLDVTNNGGIAGFWFIHDADEAKSIPDNYRDPGEFISGDFTIFPNKFYLKKGQKTTLIVRFKPQKDGFNEVGFVLACDNLRNYTFSLQAEANMIELLPSHIDDHTIYCDENNHFDRLDIRSCDFLNPRSRTVSIENKTKNKVEYEWVFDEIEDNNFQIEPKEGYFNGKEIKTFTVTFSAADLIPSYNKINLTIKGIPFESVKNPPLHILERITDLRARKRNSLSEADFLKSKIEFVYYTWQLLGEVKQLEYIIDPPLLSIPHEQPIGKDHEATFIIQNCAKSSSAFRIR